MSNQQQSNEEEVISQTKRWLETVVIGLNFCPFAGREFRKGTVRYSVLPSADPKEILVRLALELQRLDDHPEIETTLIILPNQLPDFNNTLGVILSCSMCSPVQERLCILPINHCRQALNDVIKPGLSWELVTLTE